MGDRLTIDGAGRLPTTLSDDLGDAPGLAEKKRLQQQDVSVLFDKVPLFEPPLAIAKPANGGAPVLGWNPFAVSAMPSKPAKSAPPPTIDPRNYTDDALRHDLTATTLQRDALPPNTPERAALEQVLSTLQAEGDRRWGSYDACEDAKPTLVRASRLPKETYSPQQLMSCSSQGGLCLSVDQATAIETRRQEVCASTGVDPLRFEDVADGHATADVDRGRLAAEQAKWLHVIDAETQNPLAAAAVAYSIARGESLDATVARAELAQAVGGMMASVAAAGQKVPDFDTTETTAVERVLNEPAPGELTATQRMSMESFLRANGVPEEYVHETMMGFGRGSRVGTLKEDIHAYRYYGGGTKPRGRWLTDRPQTRPIRDLALDARANSATNIERWIIPKGTRVLVGPVAELNGQPGGAMQYYVLEPTVLKPEVKK